MRYKLISCAALILAVAVGGLDSRLPPLSALAQSQSQEKPRLKEFGSSVKRLKWDPVTQAAVETRSADEEQLAATGEDVVRIDTQLVVCDVLILDKKGRAVPGLKQTDFMVTEDGRPQEIGHFSLGENREVERSIVLIIDYSPSELPYVNTSVEAAKRLVERLGPKDRMAIVTDDVELLVDFTRDQAKLKDALESMRTRVMSSGRFGRSEQFTALLATARELFSNEDFRRIIIFQTDGDEVSELQPPNTHLIEQITQPGSSSERKQEVMNRALAHTKQYSLGDISAAVEKSGATVYGVFPGSRLIGLPLRDQLDRVKAARPGIRETWKLAGLAAFQLEGQKAMTELARISGGSTAYLEKPNQAQEIYSRILSDVNSRYVIGYYPANRTRDGKRRKVLIEVRKHPEYTVEGRKSYVAPGPEQ